VVTLLVVQHSGTFLQLPDSHCVLCCTAVAAEAEVYFYDAVENVEDLVSVDDDDDDMRRRSVDPRLSRLQSKLVRICQRKANVRNRKVCLEQHNSNNKEPRCIYLSVSEIMTNFGKILDQELISYHYSFCCCCSSSCSSKKPKAPRWSFQIKLG